MKKVTWFLFVLLFAVSCLDEPECYLLNNNYVGIFFRVMGSNQPDSIDVNTLRINGRTPELAAGTLWEDLADNKVTNVPAILDYFDTQTQIYMRSGDQERAFNLAYQVQSQFVSEDCGPRYVLSDLNVLDLADSVRIVNATPSRSGPSRNIEIFRCPVTDTLVVTFYQLLLPATTASAANRSRPAGKNLNSVTINGSSTMYTNHRATRLKLPVDLTGTSTQYTFEFPEVGTRTLNVEYTTRAEKRYRPCGEQIFVSRLVIPTEEGKKSTLDSVSIARDAQNFPFSTLTDPYSNNINVYACPTTNIAQIAFRRTSTGAAANVDLESITADYTTDVFYAGSTASTVQLPLNLDANSTTFTFTFADGNTQTLTVSYQVGPPPTALFKVGYACSSIRVVTNLAATSSGVAQLVPNTTVTFPPVTNINFELP